MGLSKSLELAEDDGGVAICEDLALSLHSPDLESTLNNQRDALEEQLLGDESEEQGLESGTVEDDHTVGGLSGGPEQVSDDIDNLEKALINSETHATVHDSPTSLGKIASC